MRIAAARPAEHYLPSQSLARADLTLEWLPSAVEDGKRGDRKVAMYLIALAAAAWHAEEHLINPEGVVLRHRSGDEFSTDPRVKKYDPADEPPEGTQHAREMVRHDLRELASASKLSATDIDNLIAVFADQSLGGIKYLEEFRDAITRAGTQP